MMSLIKIYLLAISTMFLISCSGSKPSGSGSSTGGTGGTGGSGTGSAVSVPFLLEVRGNYEENTLKTLYGTCSFSASDALGQEKTCTIQIPELVLYNSDLEFSISTNNRNTCKKISFVPYYYLKSTSATLSKDGESGTTVDCSTGATDAYCWGGAAPDMIEGFPGSFGRYFLTTNFLSFKYLLKSSDVRQDTNGDRGLRTNAEVANTLPTANRAAAINNSFVRYIGSNNYQDYQFTCWDEWANINYRFTIVISDDDSVDNPIDGPNDFYWDWGF